MRSRHRCPTDTHAILSEAALNTKQKKQNRHRMTILFFLFGVQSGFAQDRVRVGWAAMTASHTPLWVAQEKGFIAKQALSVEPIFFGAGPPAMQALVAGDLDIVVTSAPNVVNPRLGGADTVMTLSIIPTFIDH